MDKIKILIVEDQRTTAKKIKGDLEKFGYEITAIVEAGEDVLERVNGNKPDLALMDIILKGKMDGIEAAKNLQAKYDIPVVYLTAYADEDLFGRALLTEPFGYLIKPFEGRELNTTIRAALYKHHTEKQLRQYKHNMEKLVDEKTLQMLATSTVLGNKGLLKQHVDDHIRKLHRVIEQTPALVVITDTKGVIEYANPAFTKLTGYAVDEVIGKNPKVLKSGTQSSEFYKKMWDTIISGRDWSNEMCNRKKDGSVYWELAYVTPLRDTRGNISNFVKTSEDITERKLMEEELKKSHRELESKVIKRTEDLSKTNAQLQKEIEERKKLINELEEALTQVKTLSGFIPICASCKKIRDDKGYWDHLEQYLREHSNAEFTHSICPDCQKELYKQI